MVIVALIVILILAAMVTTRLTSFVTSAGTFILGLSWLIGSTMQEILLACIFLFVKHPFDVGDRVDIDVSSRFRIFQRRETKTMGNLSPVGNRNKEGDCGQNGPRGRRVKDAD